MTVKELKDILDKYDENARVYIAENHLGLMYHRPMQVFQTDDGDVGFTVSSTSYARPESQNSKRDALVAVEE